MIEQKRSRGHKQCPKCKTFCGVRTEVCKECDTPFKVKTQTNRLIPRLPRSYQIYTAIRSINEHPKECPMVLREDFTKKDVIEWAHQVRLYFIRRKQWLVKAGILELARNQFLHDPAKLRAIEEVIQTLEDLQ